MDQPIVTEALDRVSEHLKQDQVEQAIAVLEALRPPDQADVFEELSEQRQQELLPLLHLGDSADILEEMEDTEAAQLAVRLQADALAPILDEMESDEAADLLGDLPPELAGRILDQMEDAEIVRPLLIHPDETAGGLMTSEFPSLRQEQTAAEALASLRAWAPAEEPGSERAYYVYVVDQYGTLTGVISLLKLLAADPWQRVGAVMEKDPMSIAAEADQEECARLMARYDLLSLPVVDQRGQLIGIITGDDLVDVLEDEATEDIQRLGGAEPLAQPYLTTSVFTIAGKRVGWLLLLLLTATLTGEVMRLFQQELEAVVALTYFIPMIIGTGGNTGSQTTSTIIRALAVRDVAFSDFLRVLWQESRVGILLGTAMGVVAFVRALTWVPEQNLALTVALSILAIVLWSTSVGSLLPMLAVRLRIDPTVVSGPAMSTLVDATGLLIYFSIARLILPI